MRRSTFAANGIGVQGGTLVVKGCTFTTNTTGINGSAALVRSSQITGTLFDGINAVTAKVKVRDSTVIGER